MKTPPSATASRNPFIALPARLSSAISKSSASATCACSPCRRSRRGLPRRLRCSSAVGLRRWPRALPRPGLLPLRRQRQFKIHVRAHTGTRIEETAALCDHVDNSIRREHPARRSRHDHRQHRPALLRLQSLLLHLRSRRHRRRRHPRPAHRRSPPHRRLRQPPARSRSPASFPASPSTSCPSTSSPRS